MPRARPSACSRTTGRRHGAPRRGHGEDGATNRGAPSPSLSNCPHRAPGPGRLMRQAGKRIQGGAYPYRTPTSCVASYASPRGEGGGNPLRAGSMRDPACGLRGTSLLRTRVNTPKGELRGSRVSLAYASGDGARGCCTDQPLPSGSLKNTNRPPGRSWTSLTTSTPRPTSSARAASMSETTS